MTSRTLCTGTRAASTIPGCCETLTNLVVVRHEHDENGGASGCDHAWECSASKVGQFRAENVGSVENLNIVKPALQLEFREGEVHLAKWHGEPPRAVHVVAGC
jgi:hypothetical protein